MKLKMLLGMLVASILSVKSVHPCQEVSLKDPKDVYTFKKAAIMSSHELGNIKLTHDNEGFAVERDGEIHRIENWDIDQDLRHVNKDRLSALEKMGAYIAVNKMSNGDYSLKLNGKLNGGGPIAGAIAYWLTKSGCYGTALAATGTIVVASGGLAGAAVGASLAGATAGATTGATVIAGAIGSAGLAGEAALATGALVSSAGGVVGAVAAVESASLAAGAFFTAIPFLP